jgi:hypothetical protein
MKEKRIEVDTEREEIGKKVRGRQREKEREKGRDRQREKKG